MKTERRARGTNTHVCKTPKWISRLKRTAEASLLSKKSLQGSILTSWRLSDRVVAHSLLNAGNVIILSVHFDYVLVSPHARTAILYLPLPRYINKSSSISLSIPSEI